MSLFASGDPPLSSPSMLRKLPRLANPLFSKALPKIPGGLPKVPTVGWLPCKLNGVDGVPNE
jgi:hypothetical protein